METADRSRSVERVLEEYRARFDGFFLPVVSGILKSESVPQLSDPSLYSLEAGGKRVRPMLVLACAGLSPEDVPSGFSAQGPVLPPGLLREALFAAASVECIHTYSLIHDDLPAMDDDDVRRGRPACHRKFPEWAALLAGDTLNTFAFRMLAESGGDVAGKLRILADAAGHAGMALGQALDLAHEKKNFHEEGPGEDFVLRFRDAGIHELLNRYLAGVSADAGRRLLAIHLHKTGALIRTSCELGALCAGPMDANLYSLFSWYGEGMGLLFQIVDDILDVVGDAATLGKRTGKDQALGKLTFPGLIGVDTSRSLAAEMAGRIRECARQIGSQSGTNPDRTRLLDDLAVYVLNRDH